MRTEMIILTGLILLTSGCLDELDIGDEEELPNRGLEVTEFSVTDPELRPEQQANIRAELTNYHEEVDIDRIELTDTGQRLIVGDRSCTPEPENLDGAQAGYTPAIECRWDVKAPPSEELEGFERYNEPVILRVEYEASVSNMDAFQVNFQPLNEIERTETERITFSNGEVSVDLATETPVAQESGSTMEATIQGEGPGRIDGDYDIEYEPREVFSDCPSSQETVIEDGVNFICTLESDRTGTETLFVSTHYKYVKEPILDVTIVNRG